MTSYDEVLIDLAREVGIMSMKYTCPYCTETFDSNVNRFEHAVTKHGLNGQLFRKEDIEKVKKELSNTGEYPKRVQLLQNAIDVTVGDREEEYGDFYVNMKNLGDMLSVYVNAKYGTDLQLNATDASMFMVFTKIARTLQSDANMADDTFVDGAGYFAMAGEAATKEKVK